MPIKPLSPCRYPGCLETQVPGGRGFCLLHAKEARRQDQQQRGTARERGYTRQYEKARQWLLKREPLCPLCALEGRLTAAVECHHIIPLSAGGTNSASNLVGLCRYHHEYCHTKEGEALLIKLKAKLESNS